MGANNELKEALKEVDMDRLTAYLVEKQCDFSMNAPPFKSRGWHLGANSERYP